MATNDSSTNRTKSAALSNELRDLDPAITSLRSRISGLGAALFDLEQTPALPLASGSNFTGLTAKTAKTMQAALGELWVGYPKLVAAMERVETARGTADSLRSGDRETVKVLMVEAHVDLAGRTLEQEHDRLSGLLSNARKNLDAIDFGFAACATIFSELDALVRSAMASAEQTGERVNEVSRLAKQLDEQRLSAAADPLGWQGSTASALGGRLRSLASELGVVLQTQDRLDELVIGGNQRLDALRVLIANGIAAATKARSRMADTDTLPTPLRVSIIDGVDGLRQRLGSVGAQLSSDPRKARLLWTLWDRDMTSTESSANVVLRANLKPIAERDALRGRLDAFEAKAAAASVVELGALVQLHRDATARLTEPPVSLSLCEEAVSAYGDAVGAAIAERVQARGGENTNNNVGSSPLRDAPQGERIKSNVSGMTNTKVNS